MGLSETIIAAAIGAAATISTALFQLFSALRSNQKSDARPKKGNTFRSVLAVAALMAVSAVGGFLFSEFRQERTAQDMHSMREEINAKLQMLATTTERLALAREQPAAPQNPVAQPIAREASLYVPACAAGAECNESQAQTDLLCDTMSDALRIVQVDLFVRPAAAQTAWDQSRAQFDQDLGGIKFVGGVSENAIAGQLKAVCVSVAHWSDQPHVARMVLNATQVPDVAAPMPEQPNVVNAALGAAVAPQLTNAVGAAR